MKPILLGLVIAGLVLSCTGGCASTTVDSEVTQGLLDPILNRTLTYLDGVEWSAQTEVVLGAIEKLTPLLKSQRVDAITARPFIEAICDAHDRFVLADVSIRTAELRSHYLRSTRILRALYTEASTPAVE